MALTGLLARRLVRGNLRQHVLLWIVFTLSFSGALGLAMVSAGAQEAMVEPLRGVVTGDVRFTEGPAELGRGIVWRDPDAVAARVDAGGGELAARFESNYVTVRGLQVHNWSAGFLAGIDPASAGERAALRPYIVAGSTFDSANATDPVTNRTRVPVLVGVDVAERLGLDLSSTRWPDHRATLTLTSGRPPGNGTIFPVSVTAVVVGVYETGFAPLDSFAAIAPIQWVRHLEGYGPRSGVANALVLHGGDADTASASGRAAGLNAETPGDFALGYLGGIVVVVAALVGIQVVLFGALLVVWLGYEVDRAVGRDRVPIAAMRALGVPFGQVRGAYVLSIAFTIVAAAAASVVVAALVASYAPAIEVELGGVGARVPWRFVPWAMWAVVAAAALGATAATLQATSALGRVDVQDGLRGA